MAVALGTEAPGDLDTIRHAIAEAGSNRKAMESGAGFHGPRAARFVAALELARRAAWEELTARPALTSPRDSEAFLKAQMAHRQY